MWGGDGTLGVPACTSTFISSTSTAKPTITKTTSFLSTTTPTDNAHLNLPRKHTSKFTSSNQTFSNHPASKPTSSNHTSSNRTSSNHTSSNRTSFISFIPGVGKIEAPKDDDSSDQPDTVTGEIPNETENPERGVEDNDPTKASVDTNSSDNSSDDQNVRKPVDRIVPGQADQRFGFKFPGTQHKVKFFDPISKRKEINGGWLGGGPDLSNPDCFIAPMAQRCGWRTGDQIRESAMKEFAAQFPRRVFEA
jgi:hypothetical protein